jgi:hypothetical protein
MIATQLIGYGRFHLDDFRLGEEFCRYDGSLAKVCERQPYRQLNPTTRHLLFPDRVQVWIELGTSNAARVLLHRRAIVHAVTPEQARRIEARIRARKGG